MSKSAGGFIQLIIPSESMKWADYKKKYGIDLDELFRINEDEFIVFRPGINKPVLISGYENKSGGDSYGDLPNCGFLTVARTSEGQYSNSLGLYFGDPDSSGYCIILDYSKRSKEKTINGGEI